MTAGFLMAALLLSACSESGPLPFVPTPEPTPEQPREVTVVALDRTSGDPVPGVQVSAAGSAVPALTDASGQAVVTAMRGAAVELRADGYDPASAKVPDSGELQVEIRSNVVSGVVTDADGKPLAGVRVFVDGSTDFARTDAAGSYSLGNVPETGTLVYKMPGFRLVELAIDPQMTADVAMQSFEARALYAPGAVFEAPGRLDQLLDLIDRTEVNAMVIDVKETGGWLYYETDLPEAVASGAAARPIFDLAELLPKLKERGIYTIARMVCMKDNTVGASEPELAVRNSATGEPWRDNNGGIWLDPAAPGVAEYLAAIAGDLADKGFDEVQLDYIRFFSDGPYDVAHTNLPNTQSFRLPAIRRVLRVISDRMQAEKAFLSADVFPISFIVPDDQGIGQRPEVIMPYVDYFSPMVYPSHYGPGVFGHPVPNTAPYDVIDKTLKIMNREAAGLTMKIRPWIQDFGYGDFPPYTAAQVREEMRAAADNGAHGWMIWNARAFFTEAALGPPRDDEDPSPITSVQPAPSPSAGG
ncbi:MAG TPA: putative glycoside hydrolase [Candidatus Limnocylindrales bacterium]|nr:putative glycoside hydrolase [Candidatus Limnocylindrales bacterium]